MNSFTAYFDASGRSSDTHLGASLFVAGFISSTQKWLHFEREWLAFLDKHGIRPPFHMTDFEAGAGQYSSWKGDFKRRQGFLIEASKVIVQHTQKPFSHGVVIADLQRLFSEYDIPENYPREPYPWCAIRVCRAVSDWARRQVGKRKISGADPIEFVFEKGDLHTGKLMKIAGQLYGITPIFRRKEETSSVAFQACDILAWEHRRFLSQVAGGTSKHRPRESLIEMVRLFPNDAFTFQRWGKLEAESQRLGFDKRALMT